MKEFLLLEIPKPCAEDWDRMLPVERGRHCEQCCKTVVDFTEMSDAEVLRFFKERSAAASGGVCGRFASDQLGRKLAPAPIQRNGWKGWQLVLAGALVFGKGPDGARPAKARVEVSIMDRNGALDRPDTSELVFSGGVVPKLLYEKPVVKEELRADTTPMTIGQIGSDDSVPEMPPDTVRSVAAKPDYRITGAVKIINDTVLCTRKLEDDSVVADTAGPLIVGGVDSVAGLVGSRRDVVTVYPNPVMRGGVMQMKWDAPAGTYSVVLLDLHGQINQERELEVAGKGQVDEWALPGGLAAGIYFLRVARPGDRAVTKEILIQ
jgi:hypothetical protein